MEEEERIGLIQVTWYECRGIIRLQVVGQITLVESLLKFIPEFLLICTCVQVRLYESFARGDKISSAHCFSKKEKFRDK